jgi:glycosyltransferase involved in cell wall biosynthesis
MKIGINGSFARKPDTGMGQVTVNFLKSLAEMADEKDEFYIYLEEDLPKGFGLPKNFKKRVLKTFYKRDDLFRKFCWEKYFLPLMVKEDNCEVFFSLYQSPTILKNISHIMLVHDTITKIFPWYLNNFRKKIYYGKVDRAIKQASKLMTVSEHSKIDINRIYDVEKSKIIVNYIDCDPIFKNKISNKEIKKTLKKHQLEKSNYIFYIGGFDMRKNANGLIRAYGMLWNKYENKKDCPDLVLAGKFNSHLVPLITDIKKEIQEVRKIYKIPKNKFRELGFVEQADLPVIYKGAKTFCFPSLYEGFGLPVLEAFNCGCPVVTSENSSLKEIANKKNAFIFDLEHDKNLAEKLWESLNADQKIIDRKTEEARKFAKRFDWRKFTEKALCELKSSKVKSL